MKKLMLIAFAVLVALPVPAMAADYYARLVCYPSTGSVTQVAAAGHFMLDPDKSFPKMMDLYSGDPDRYKALVVACGADNGPLKSFAISMVDFTGNNRVNGSACHANSLCSSHYCSPVGTCAPMPMAPMVK